MKLHKHYEDKVWSKEDDEPWDSTYGSKDALHDALCRLFNTKDDQSVKPTIAHKRKVNQKFGALASSGAGHTHSIGGVAAIVEPEKISMSPVKELKEGNLGTLAKCNPQLVETLFRHRLEVLHGWPPRDWLNRNCKGFYLIDESEGPSNSYGIGFELEDDLLLFKMQFEGTVA